MNPIVFIINLANKFDKLGLYKEADILDKVAAEYKDFLSHLAPGEYEPDQLENFMRNKETGERAPTFLDDTVCECGEPMSLKVLETRAGYYLGRACPKCGPYSRESGYFKSEELAKKELEGYNKKASIIVNASKNELIRALKDDDARAAKKALTGMSGEDLGLTHEEFRNLMNEIDMASKSAPGTMGQKFGLDAPRELLGVGKNVKLDPLTHNPLTGQPWTSGPAPKMNNQLYKELLQLKTLIEPHRGKAAGRYFVSVLPPEDYIGVDAGLAFKPDELVERLEQSGYKKHIPDGETASRSKVIGKDRIVVDVDIAGYAVPTDISVSPMTEENYNAVTKVFGGVPTMFMSGGQHKEIGFDEAVKEFEDYMKQPVGP